MVRKVLKPQYKPTPLLLINLSVVHSVNWSESTQIEFVLLADSVVHRYTNDFFCNSGEVFYFPVKESQAVLLYTEMSNLLMVPFKISTW